MTSRFISFRQGGLHRTRTKRQVIRLFGCSRSPSIDAAGRSFPMQYANRWLGGSVRSPGRAHLEAAPLDSQVTLTARQRGDYAADLIMSCWPITKNEPQLSLQGGSKIDREEPKKSKPGGATCPVRAKGQPKYPRTKTYRKARPTARS
jgi:hypothetical protein